MIKRRVRHLSLDFNLCLEANSSSPNLCESDTHIHKPFICVMSAGRHSSLIPLCLGFILTIVVWIYDTFENYLRIKHECAKFLKENCVLNSDLHFSYKYFENYHLIKKISLK